MPLVHHFQASSTLPQPLQRPPRVRLEASQAGQKPAEAEGEAGAGLDPVDEEATSPTEMSLRCGFFFAIHFENLVVLSHNGF